MTCQRVEPEDTEDSEQEFYQKAGTGSSRILLPATHCQIEGYSEVPLQESSTTARDQFFLCLKDTGPFVEGWTDLESVIQHEDREKQTSHTNMYVWNPEKWYW